MKGTGASRVSCAVLVACAIGGATLAATPSDVPDPELVRVLERFDRVQGDIRTLSADFTWTTESPLLQEAMVSEGRLFLTKPDSVRWEFTSPEAMSFVIAHDEYVGYFPAQKKAERREFARASKRLFRYFGLGQASDELSEVYRIRLGESDLADADLLVLEPKKRRARKRIADLRIWVSRETGLPVRVAQASGNGGRRTMEFAAVRVNPQIARGTYDLELPSDVTVTSSADGLGGAFRIAPGPSSE